MSTMPACRQDLMWSLPVLRKTVFVPWFICLSARLLEDFLDGFWWSFWKGVGLGMRNNWYSILDDLDPESLTLHLHSGITAVGNLSTMVHVLPWGKQLWESPVRDNHWCQHAWWALTEVYILWVLYSLISKWCTDTHRASWLAFCFCLRFVIC